MERTPLRHYIQYGHGILMLVFMLFTHANATETEMTRRLALLVAAPWEGETAMHNDVVATYNALRQRGFSPEELLVLEGPLTRSLLLTFLQDVHRRTALWQQGEVMVCSQPLTAAAETWRSASSAVLETKSRGVSRAARRWS